MGQNCSEREGGFVQGAGRLGLSLSPLRPIAERSLFHARRFPRVRLSHGQIHPAKRQADSLQS
jgi:hypothetical protein